MDSALVSTRSMPCRLAAITTALWFRGGRSPSNSRLSAATISRMVFRPAMSRRRSISELSQRLHNGHARAGSKQRVCLLSLPFVMGTPSTLVQPASDADSNRCSFQRVRISGLGWLHLVLGIGSVGIPNVGATGAADGERALDDPRLLAQDPEAGTPVARAHDSVETILHVPGRDIRQHAPTQTFTFARLHWFSQKLANFAPAARRG